MPLVIPILLHVLALLLTRQSNALILSTVSAKAKLANGSRSSVSLVRWRQNVTLAQGLLALATRVLLSPDLGA